MSGISYDPPLENLAIFDPSVFLYGDAPLTQQYALNNFLRFPTAQGTENFGDLNSSGTANLYNANIDNQVSFTSTANLLTANSWSGDIASVNTVANLTHYLGFFDSSSTGSGKPQKNASLSCNPSTGTITATTFNGSISNATGVSLTSDDTSGTYLIPFSKTTAATGNALFIDNTTTPLTYNPLSSTLTSTIFSGSATTAGVSDTNINATYYPVFVSAAGNSQTLRCDIATGPFAYNPSTGNMTIGGTLTSSVIAPDNTQFGTTTSAISSFSSNTLTLAMGSYTFRNFGWVVTGTTNSMNTLSIGGTRINGVYNVCIVNSGSGSLTINNTGLGTNTLCQYTAPVVVLSNNLAVMTITILSVNTITRIIVDCYNVSP